MWEIHSLPFRDSFTYSYVRLLCDSWIGIGYQSWALQGDWSRNLLSSWFSLPSFKQWVLHHAKVLHLAMVDFARAAAPLCILALATATKVNLYCHEIWYRTITMLQCYIPSFAHHSQHQSCWVSGIISTRNSTHQIVAIKDYKIGLLLSTGFSNKNNVILWVRKEAKQKINQLT